MADELYKPTYDEYSTYSETDLSGGGEQLASAIYVNDLNKQQQQSIDGKQNATVLQPTTPPSNPSIGDMWVDISYFPRVIYTWNGTAWEQSGVISVNEVGGYTTAQADTINNQIRLDINAVSDRTDVVEETLADGEGLADTITQTTTYQLNRDSAIDGKIDTFEGNLNDENYVETNIPALVTQSKLTEKANEITAAFSKGGGVNVLLNSTGFAYDGGATYPFLHWQITSGAVTQYVGSDCIESGVGFTMTTGRIMQTLACIPGQSYTITAKVKKGTAGTAYMKISDGTTFQQVDMIATQSYNYTTIQVANFVPSSGTIIVELDGNGATGGVIFTAIMLNVGAVGLQWSYANGESYNSAVHFDINGVRVTSNVYDGYTVMSPQEFSGYARNSQGNMERVFTLNKETTEVSRLLVDSDVIDNMELQMGTMRIKYINSGGKTGWAFLPNS